MKQDPPGTASRRAALRLLDAVLRRGLPLESALDAAARDLERADDRAFAHAIAAEALRRLPDLDELIDHATKKRLPDDAKARFALRIALVQALAMNTPHHAAISTVLPLVDGGPRKLVHGVFSAVMRQKWALPEVPHLPIPVAERWRKAWGQDAVAAAERLIAVPPPIDLFGEPPGDLDGISLMPGHLRLPRGADIAGLAGHAEGSSGESGRWWVQDISAAIPARLLGAGAGKAVLDLCAAPGGKTMQIAAAGHHVTAVDQAESRLKRLRENLDRTHLDAKLVAADAAKWKPHQQFDAILLDAPCSATGTFRRHPEVLHRARPQIIRDSVDLQKELLTRATSWLKPGGSLVYAVCSLEPDEGEQLIGDFLARDSSFRTDPPQPGELPDFVTPSPEGWVRVLPGLIEEQGGLDGFFVARLVRMAT